MEKDKRKARRIHFMEPVEASLSHNPVNLVDLSSSGARIQHAEALPFNREKKFMLHFKYEGERFSLNCQLVRSRFEKSARQLAYTTGVRFVDLTEEAHEALWGLLAMLAIGNLQQHVVADVAVEFEIVA